MKQYELIYLILPGLSEEEQKSLSQRVASFIGTQPENKQGNAFWVSFNFGAEPEKIKDIEKQLKAEPSIKKYMIVKKEIHKPESLIRKRRKIVKEELTEKPKTKMEKPKVELKEIEKKLDEILKE